jgi:hypothetical protein
MRGCYYAAIASVTPADLTVPLFSRRRFLPPLAHTHTGLGRFDGHVPEVRVWNTRGEPKLHKGSNATPK